MSKLVEQLRIMGAWFESDGWTANAAIATRGANEIERLHAIAVERMDLFRQAATKVEEMTSALEAALPHLDNSDSPGGCNGKHTECGHCAAIAKVRRALAT
jgi:hypothetical protein